MIENKRTGNPALTGRRNFSRFLTFFICLGAGIFFGSYRLMKRYPPGMISTVPGRASGLLLLLTGLFFGILGTWILFLVIESSVADFGWNHNVFVFAPLDLIIVMTGFRWLIQGRTCVIRPVRIYILLRLIMLAVVSVLPVSGIMAYQDNRVFIAAVSMVLLGMLLGLPGCRNQDR